MELNATLIAQIIDLIIIVGVIYGIIFAVRFFKDLKKRLISIEEKLNEITKN